MTITAYPLEFTPLAIAKDNKGVIVGTKTTEIKTASGTYGGFGENVTTWQPERILTRKEKHAIKQAQYLEKQGRLGELYLIYAVKSSAELKARYTALAVANARRGIVAR